jgi:hypothetical protein
MINICPRLTGLISGWTQARSFLDTMRSSSGLQKGYYRPDKDINSPR